MIGQAVLLLIGAGFIALGGSVISLARKVRRLEDQLADVPRRFKAPSVRGVRGGHVYLDETHLFEKDKPLPGIRETKLPRGKGF